MCGEADGAVSGTDRKIGARPVREPSVRLYVDENGNHNLREDLSNEGNRYLCLTGVAMYLSEHKKLEEALNRLKTAYFGNAEVILHRREIISGKPPFETLKDDAVRDSFNNDLLEIVSNIEYRVMSILIDKKAHVEKDGIFEARDPYVIALEHLMQQYQYWLQRFKKPVLGDILAESRGGREDRTTKEAYKYVYEGKGYIKLKNTEQFLSSKEIKLKRKKDNIAGLQFVDLLSHPARRYILAQHGLSHNTKPYSFEQQIVDILVNDKFSRKNEKIDGCGTVFYP